MSFDIPTENPDAFNRLTLSPESPKIHDFWLGAANVTGTPAFNPTSFEELKKGSPVQFIGSIQGIDESSGKDSFASVRLKVVPEVLVDGKDGVIVTLNFPVMVTSDNVRRVVPEFPKERVLWMLGFDPDTQTYYCSSPYLCAFINTDQGVRSATAPNTSLDLAWPRFNPATTIDKLNAS